MRKAGWGALLATLVGGAYSSQIAAIDWGEEYANRIKATEVVSPLGDDMFGDQINLFNGTVSFSATDVSLPGNSALPVTLSRSFNPEDRSYGWSALGDWEIDAPYLVGTYTAQGLWGPSSRCSTVAAPPPVNGVNYSSFWSGVQLHSEKGGGDLLAMTTDSKLVKPTFAEPVKWVTKGGWYFSCLTGPLASGHAGEGFVGHAPDGTQYTFNWMVTLEYPGILRKDFSPGGQSQEDLFVARKQVRIYATEVRDRFQNWVRYDWSGGRLNKIHANDGRQITFQYNATDGRLLTATVPTGTEGDLDRVWTYQYRNPTTPIGRELDAVINPDQSRWKYVRGARSVTSITYPTENGKPIPDSELHCWLSNQMTILPATYSVTHPSGAQAEFTFLPMRHGRTNVFYKCTNYDDDPWNDYNLVPLTHDVLSLTKKRITGLGLAAAEYFYTYEGLEGGYAPKSEEDDELTHAEPPPHYKYVTILEPDGTKLVHKFGKDNALNEGQLFQIDVSKVGVPYKKTVSTYVTTEQAATLPFPASMGSSLVAYGDSFTAAGNRPLVSTVTTLTQQSVSFTRQVPVDAACANNFCFDAWARAKRVSRGNSLGDPAKVDETVYRDNLSSWVIGQVASVTNINTGRIESRTTYHANDLPWKTYRFELPQQVLTYNTTPGTAAGTLATVADGRGNAVTLSNWWRGIPTTITFPATPDQPTPVSRTAVVNDFGWITSVTDENGIGYTTTYKHDPMGRLAKVIYPAGEGFGDTTQSFVSNAPTKYGLPANHWQQTVSTGNARKVVHFDALWRPLVTETYDSADEANTRSVSVTRYNVDGTVAFQSYPMRTLSNYATVTGGTAQEYDALDRVTAVKQDSEQGVLLTKTEYLPGFKTRVTSPKHQGTSVSTITEYKTWDQPSMDLPVKVTHPEGAVTTIDRNIFGQPRVLGRGTAAGTLIERRNVYDAYQRVCKTIEPETGATVMDYDASGNLVWSASGLDLPDATCDLAAGLASGRIVGRTYDQRNRLKTLDFLDTRGSQTWKYKPDGLPWQVHTTNVPGTMETVNTYEYNKRRMLLTETVLQGEWFTFGLGYDYDANGSLERQYYPSGEYVDYAPNALGQPRKVANTTQDYATSIKYHPNGAIAQFTYGNDILHTMIQNDRLLPEESHDGTALHLGYGYDKNANVSSIVDIQRGASKDRTMLYDNLERLVEAKSPMFGPTLYHRFTYDVLDNLKTWKNGARDDLYCYGAENNRLEFIRTSTSCSSGPASTTLGYDMQGNVASNDSTLFDFDYGNRLREASYSASMTERYRYDAHGRRVLASRIVGPADTLGVIFSQYASNGQLLYQEDQRPSGSKTTDYVYLGGSLIAQREEPLGGGTAVIKYQHTDALGSPMAVTNSDAELIEQFEYEPYGKVQAVLGTQKGGPGFTGHVWDAATGMNYMQQRYYDPAIGRFLSVDPVTADGNSGGNFNRYWYANNNPYKFTDPDGRWSRADKRRPGDAGASFYTDSVTGMDVNAPGYEPINRAPPRRSKRSNVTVGKPETPSTSNVQQVLENVCGQSAGVCAKPPEGPDYVHVYVNYWVGTLGLTLTKNGTLFGGGGPAHGTPRSLVSGKPGASITLGYMTVPTSGSGVDNFVTGATTSVGFFHGGGAAYSTNAAGSAFEVGAGVGGPTIQAFEYMTPILQLRSAGE